MKVIKLIPALTFFRFPCFIFWLVTCPLIWGQAGQKRILEPSDYKLWHLLIPDQISNDGNWVSYRLRYDYNNKDTLFVKETKGSRKHFFPNGLQSKFNAELQFACLSKDTMHLQNLKTGIVEKFPNTSDFDFSADNRFMAFISKTADRKSSLEIRNSKGNVIFQRKGITAYKFDPDQKGIFYACEENNHYSVELIVFANTMIKKTLMDKQAVPPKKLLWKTGGISFTVNSPEQSILYYYNTTQHKLSVLDSKTTTGFPKAMQISDSPISNSIHSKDGKKVIVWLKENSIASANSDAKKVEIWNTKDKLLFDSRKYMGDPKMSDKMALWNLQENKLLQITDREFSRGFLSADYRYAFIYNPIAYEPQNRQHCPYDLYLMDLKTGRRKLLIINYTMEQKPSGSPDGNYLCYAQNGQWWIYNITKDTHTCITKNIPVSFFSEDLDRPAEPMPYGIGGWTSDGQIVLYDRYDLWKISLDGKTKMRLTEGREILKSFRIKAFNSDPFYSDTESNKHSLDLSKGMLLTPLDREKPASGFSYWTATSGVKELVWENKAINQIMKASNKDKYLYIDQNFGSAPRLMLYDELAIEIIQSNPQQQKFYWSRNEKIEFYSGGKKTKGILFYPADFNANVKYPMVVNIYERQFSYMNEYLHPSIIFGDGFNIHHYTANGYFVLLPDINYEFGNLKKSVTKSVVDAVDAVVAKGHVDPEKVGLIGHSFGGYETDLIITQTNRFAAAVAGAPWTDLVGAYLYAGPMFQRPDFFRAEEHQLRIGKSLFEDMQSYLDNSPVLLASGVNTPLLGWVGADDRHVHARNSMEFYLALRRLKKEHTLLIYPNEEHTLEQNENALDLNVRIMQWFNYYLKNETKSVWINSAYE